MSSNIWLSAASPLFFYSPYSAYFDGSPYTASWTGAIDTSLQAPNNTYKSISGTGSVILPSIFSTSFTPIWNSPPGYSPGLIHGKDPLLPWVSGNATASNFDSQTWQVVASCNQTGGCGGEFEFIGAWVGTQLAPYGSEIVSATLDDAADGVTYLGFTILSANSSAVSAPTISPTSADINNTLSYTSTNSASASVSFKGASILVTGLTDPSSGSYTATLDGNTVATLDAGNNVTVHGVTMFFATNLDTTAEHSLVLTCESGGLVLDSWTVYGIQGSTGFLGGPSGSATMIPPSATPFAGPTGTSQPINPSTTPVAPIAATTGGSLGIGTIIGAILGTLAAILLLWILFRRIVVKAAPKEKKLNPWDGANLLQNMKNEEVHITTAAKQRYVYPGLIAHSALKKY